MDKIQRRKETLQKTLLFRRQSPAENKAEIIVQIGEDWTEGQLKRFIDFSKSGLKDNLKNMTTVLCQPMFPWLVILPQNLF